MLDAVEKHGAWSPCGEEHPLAILKAAQVRIIKRRLKRGEPVKPIAVEYGVSLGAIYSIRNGENWRSVA